MCNRYPVSTNQAAIAPYWSVGVEYDHVFLGSRNIQLTTTPRGVGFQSDRISQDIDIGLELHVP